jgi:hypothetical protein
MPYAHGQFPFSFNLKIARAGCEFQGRIKPNSKLISKLLPAWFEHAAISGYGDMQALETKIDDEVRSAREIPATEFSVDPTLLEVIQAEWADRFLPRKVRAEPYKIHIYGDQGHFKSHRDTPEKDLVGTFLIGLGDTSWPYGDPNFHIGDLRLRADACSWVAFYPDVAHSISRLKESYRAVIAFKIFRREQSDDKIPEEFGIRCKAVFADMEPPYGIFLHHQYCMGTTELNGFDNLLLASARSSAKGQVHLIPVLTRFQGEYFFDKHRKDEIRCATHVYPFTDAHVDLILEKNTKEAKEEIKWLEGVEDVPFYGVDFKNSVLAWKEETENGEGYNGNEADSMRQDSIYLSYSLLVLPEEVRMDD